MNKLTWWLLHKLNVWQKALTRYRINHNMELPDTIIEERYARPSTARYDRPDRANNDRQDRYSTSRPRR